MGSRAVITTSYSDEPETSQEFGLYTQFLGPRNCVESFLIYCKMQGFTSPEENKRGWDDLYAVMENYSGENARIEIGKCCDLGIEYLDYGVYVIRDWEIIDRQYQFIADESNYDAVYSLILKIDQSQPKAQQLGKEKIDKLWETLNPEYKLYLKLAEKFKHKLPPKENKKEKRDIER